MLRVRRMLRVLKKFKKYGIFCHKNTKFLHTIAEDFLYIMHKKWKRYVYLETNTTAGKFEVGISKYVITRRPLQLHIVLR